MIAHERLVEEVASLARISTREAVRAVKVTLAAVTHRLETPQRQRLRGAVPGPERDATLATVPPAGGGAAELSEELGRHLETSPERGLYLAQTVLSCLAQADAELAGELRESLPAACARLFSMPERYPERMNATSHAPAPLSQRELDTQLRRRPQWDGDVHQLTRTVALPADRLPPLLHQVDKDAQALNHHCGRHRTQDGVRFTLRTHSIDAVTELDLTLADRIDAAVYAVGSGGRPG